MAANSIVSIKDLDFSYDKKTKVFEGFNLDIEKGDLLGLLGPNASGKSTLFKILKKLYPVKNGCIFIKSIDLNHISIRENAKHISYVPQMHKPLFSYSVLDFIMMGRNPYLDIFQKPGKEDLEICMNALNITGISHLRDRAYTDLSGGQVQLVMMARSIAQGSDIFLLDEPSSHLDIKNQMIMLNKLVGIAKEKCLTVLLVVHDPNIAMRFCNKCVLLKEGKVIGKGNTADILTSDNLEKLYDIKISSFSSDKRTAFFPEMDVE